MAVPPLTILTLNTGTITRVPMGSVGRLAIEIMLPMIDAEGGPVPTLPNLHVGMFFPRLASTGARANGAAYFQIGHEPGMTRSPVSMVHVAWTEQEDSACWKQTMLGYRPLKQSLTQLRQWREPPLARPPCPWAAVILTPFWGLIDTDTATRVTNLHVVLAVALIESGDGGGRGGSPPLEAA